MTYLIIFISLAVLVFVSMIAIISITSLIMYGYVKVPYVPTPKEGVEKMFNLAKVQPNDIVYDLGCGNGNLVFKAEKEYGAKACGFELSPWPYSIAKTRQFFSHSKAKIIFKNFLNQDLSDANVIFCFLMPGACKKVSQKLDSELKNNTRIVSYGFGLLDMTNFVLAKKIYNNNTPIFYYENNKLSS